MLRTPLAIPSDRRAVIVGRVAILRALAARALPRMYRPADQLFAFTERAASDGLVAQGISRRYSAIAVIGLETDRRFDGRPIMDPDAVSRVVDRLLGEIELVTSLGDAALIAWAAAAAGRDTRRAWRRVVELDAVTQPHALVDLAWTLAATCIDADASPDGLREVVADRLMGAFNPRSAVFPHVIGHAPALRSHVSCFADAVYPIHALALYSSLSGKRGPLSIASQCAARLCELQGPSGQWWWHYDGRTGKVIERYPVYSIHQDAMAPMALFALDAAGGPAFHSAVDRGLEWLYHVPELGGKSLVDFGSGTLWRKVGRREIGKAARVLQAGASALHPALRIPAVDRLMPPNIVDYEDRPYHWGWFLYAWAARPRG